MKLQLGLGEKVSLAGRGTNVFQSSHLSQPGGEMSLAFSRNIL